MQSAYHYQSALKVYAGRDNRLFPIVRDAPPCSRQRRRCERFEQRQGAMRPIASLPVGTITRLK